VKIKNESFLSLINCTNKYSQHLFSLDEWLVAFKKQSVLKIPLKVIAAKAL
jgi:hypothetical protein